MKKLLAGIALAALTAGSASTAAEKAPVDAKALFESKCSACHTIDRPKGKKKSKEGWEATVTRMIKTNGARVTDEEAKAIIDYLAANFGTK